MGLTRDIHPDTLAALGGVFHPILMVYLDWPGGAMRAHSGVGPITWGGNIYAGVGAFGGVEIPGESMGLAASRLSLSLLGVPPDIWDKLEAPIRNRPGKIWEGLTTKPGGNVVIGEPIELFVGVMDAMRYRLRKDGGDLIHAVQLDLRSGPPARAKANLFHSYESQIAEFPGDTAGRLFINAEAEAENITWPA